MFLNIKCWYLEVTYSDGKEGRMGVGWRWDCPGLDPYRASASVNRISFLGVASLILPAGIRTNESLEDSFILSDYILGPLHT